MTHDPMDARPEFAPSPSPPMDSRSYFAAAALQGFCASGSDKVILDKSFVARECWYLADAVLAARDETDAKREAGLEIALGRVPMDGKDGSAAS